MVMNHPPLWLKVPPTAPRPAVAADCSVVRFEPESVIAFTRGGGEEVEDYLPSRETPTAKRLIARMTSANPQTAINHDELLLTVPPTACVSCWPYTSACVWAVWDRTTPDMEGKGEGK
jgi:hypothetical protein